MTRCIIALILIFSLTIATKGQQAILTEKETLQKVVTGLFEGLSELDVDKTKAFCTTDITILENGKVWNFDSLALLITTRKAKSPDFNRINKIDFLETKVSENIAWISYFNQATITLSGKTVIVKWIESVVLKKENNKWKISLLHSTELEQTEIKKLV